MKDKYFEDNGYDANKDMERRFQMKEEKYQDDTIECKQTESGYCEFPGQCKDCDYGCRGHKHKDIKEGIYCDLSKSRKCEHKGIPCTQCILVVGPMPEHLLSKDAEEKWDLFCDRTKSLLERWDKFVKQHSGESGIYAIKACLQEINDEFTQHLLK